MGQQVIYRATNKQNNKIYIGFDSNWPKRKIAHKTKSKTGSKLYFHNAIRKYGFENFEWDILLEDANLEDEKILIEKYNSNNRNIGYNMTIGGDGTSGYKHNIETRKIIGIHSLGNKNTLGKTWKKTKEQIENSRQASMKKWEIIDKTGTTYIVTGLREFSEKHGICYQNLWKTAKGLRKHAMGYKCRRLLEW